MSGASEFGDADGGEAQGAASALASTLLAVSDELRGLNRLVARVDPAELLRSAERRVAAAVSSDAGRDVNRCSRRSTGVAPGRTAALSGAVPARLHVLVAWWLHQQFVLPFEAFAAAVHAPAAWPPPLSPLSATATGAEVIADDLRRLHAYAHCSATTTAAFSTAPDDAGVGAFVIDRCDVGVPAALRQIVVYMIRNGALDADLWVDGDAPDAGGAAARRVWWAGGAGDAGGGDGATAPAAVAAVSKEQHQQGRVRMGQVVHLLVDPQVAAAQLLRGQEEDAMGPFVLRCARELARSRRCREVGRCGDVGGCGCWFC